MVLKLTPKEKVVKTKVQLQKKAPFFAHLVMNMNIKEDTNVPTMGVDFKGNARFNPTWIDELSPAETEGVLCHEVMHVALTHLIRLGTKNPMLWNVACDLIINYMILKEGFKLPKGVLLPDIHTGDCILPISETESITINVIDKTAEELYELLDKKLPKCQCNCHSASGDSEGTGQDEEDEGSSSCCSCQKLNGFDQHEYGKNLSDAEREEIRKDWRGKLVDAATAARMRGDLPAYLDRIIEDLLNPQLNWRALLYQWITRDIKCNETYAKPNKRSYSYGIYLPSPVRENLNIAVTVDTSGSISDEEYTFFLSEITGIAHAFEQINMDLLYWDTEVNNVVKITKGNRNDISTLPSTGGGGTTIGCLSDYYEGKQPPQLMVHLTDGWVEENPILPPTKHLFVVCKGGRDDILKDHGILTHLGD
tara:strand:+ start:6035 stop:7300 length:1266 start_codon:yes stop_codon:yes gene_type:complete